MSSELHGSALTDDEIKTLAEAFKSIETVLGREAAVTAVSEAAQVAALSRVTGALAEASTIGSAVMEAANFVSK